MNPTPRFSNQCVPFGYLKYVCQCRWLCTRSRDQNFKAGKYLKFFSIRLLYIYIVSMRRSGGEVKQWTLVSYPMTIKTKTFNVTKDRKLIDERRISDFTNEQT